MFPSTSKETLKIIDPAPMINHLVEISASSSAFKNVRGDKSSVFEEVNNQLQTLLFCRGLRSEVSNLENLFQTTVEYSADLVSTLKTMRRLQNEMNRGLSSLNFPELKDVVQIYTPPIFFQTKKYQPYYYPLMQKMPSPIELGEVFKKFRRSYSFLSIVQDRVKRQAHRVDDWWKKSKQMIGGETRDMLDSLLTRYKDGYLVPVSIFFMRYMEKLGEYTSLRDTPYDPSRLQRTPIYLLDARREWKLRDE